MTTTLDPDSAIGSLERFWELPHGYFFRLRQGDYDPYGANEVEEIIRSIKVSEDTPIPRRLVSLIWIIPTFMEWQIDRVAEVGGDVGTLRGDITRLRSAVEDFLGVP